jgi:hypothetical protein
MRTPAQLITDTMVDAKGITRLQILALVVVHVVEQKIVDFDLVVLESEAAALARLSALVNAAWVAVGVFAVVTLAGQIHVLGGPIREFKNDPQVVKFLIDLVNSSHAYYTQTQAKTGRPRGRPAQVKDLLLTLKQGMRAGPKKRERIH